MFKSGPASKCDLQVMTSPTARPSNVVIAGEGACEDMEDLAFKACLFEQGFNIFMPNEVLDEFGRFAESSSTVGDVRQKMIRGTPASMDTCFDHFDKDSDTAILMAKFFWGPEKFLAAGQTELAAALATTFAVRLQCARARYQYVGNLAPSLQFAPKQD